MPTMNSATHVNFVVLTTFAFSPVASSPFYCLPVRPKRLFCFSSPSRFLFCFCFLSLISPVPPLNLWRHWLPYHETGSFEKDLGTSCVRFTHALTFSNIRYHEVLVVGSHKVDHVVLPSLSFEVSLCLSTPSAWGL